MSTWWPPRCRPWAAPPPLPYVRGPWLPRDGAPRGQRPGFGSCRPRMAGLRSLSSLPATLRATSRMRTNPGHFVKPRKPGSKGLPSSGDACGEPPLQGVRGHQALHGDRDRHTPGCGPPAVVCRPETLTEGESIGDGRGGGEGEAPAGAARLQDAVVQQVPRFLRWECRTFTLNYTQLTHHTGKWKGRKRQSSLSRE